MSFAVISSSSTESMDTSVERQPAVRLVDRERELRWLSAGLRAAVRGAGALIAVEGAPGIGKSRLLLEGRARAREAGMHVLSARAEVPADVAGLAVERPVLIAIDDVERCDRESLRVLAALALRLDDLPGVALLVARRDDAPICADPTALDALTGDPGAIRIRLGPLDVAGAAELVHRGVGSAPQAEFAARVHRVTGGNPALISELVLAIGERAIVPDDAHADELDRLALPRVARSVRAQAAEIGADAEALLAAIAVLGEDATIASAAALGRQRHPDAADRCGELVSAGVLASHDPPRFAQPLLRPALYASIAPGERLRLHGEAGRALAAAGAPVAAVVAHLLSAAPARDPWAARTLRAAAHAARADGAIADACGWLRRAVLEGVPELEAGLVRDLALAEASGGEPEAARRLEHALKLGADPSDRAEISLVLARLLAADGDTAGARATCAVALRELGDDGDAALRSRLNAELIAASPFEQPRRAEEAGMDGGAADALTLALGADAAIRTAQPREHALELARRALAGGCLLSERESLIPLRAVDVLVVAEHLSEANMLLDTALAASTRAGLPWTTAALRAQRARVLLRLGDVCAAIEHARAALAAIHAPRGPIHARASATLVEGLIEVGDVDAAAEALAELRGGFDASDPGAVLAPARVLIAQGRHADALIELEAASSTLRAWGVANPALAPWRSLAADCHLALGNRAAARELANAELALARTFGAPAAEARAHRLLGRSVEGEDGVASLREAVRLLEVTPLPLELARALLDLGTARSRGGDQRVAREDVRRAMALAHRAGATALSARARDAVIAAGGRPRRPMNDGLDSLTSTERRIAELAASGCTNREIGEQLYVTVNTVSTHLRSIYRKLGIGSRAQLPQPQPDDEIGAT